MDLDNLFEELSVTELEDRLELTGRCVCRAGGDEVPTDEVLTPVE